jgi:hypothetical protein
MASAHQEQCVLLESAKMMPEGEGRDWPTRNSLLIWVTKEG